MPFNGSACGAVFLSIGSASGAVFLSIGSASGAVFFFGGIEEA
jgi:hypothetical protein